MLEAGMKAPEFAAGSERKGTHIGRIQREESDLIFLSERQHSGMYKTGMWFRRIIS